MAQTVTIRVRSHGTWRHSAFGFVTAFSMSHQPNVIHLRFHSVP